MDDATLQGVLTVVLMLAFIGVCVWAWSRRRKPTFDRAAKMPLEEDDGTVPDDKDSPR